MAAPTELSKFTWVGWSEPVDGQLIDRHGRRRLQNDFRPETGFVEGRQEIERQIVSSG